MKHYKFQMSNILWQTIDHGAAGICGSEFAKPGVKIARFVLSL